MKGVRGVREALGVLAVLGALGVQQVPPRDTRTSAAAAGGTVRGVVTSDEPQPRPLRRARVTLTGPSIELPRTTITADDGTFAFERVAPGRFTVTAAKDGYVSMAYGAARTGRPGAGVTVGDRQTAQLRIGLPRGAVITGTIVDIDGQPAAGVLVFAQARRFVGGQGEFRYLAAGMPNPSITDDRGVYRIFGLPAGDYLIAAQPQVRQVGNPGSEVRTMNRGAVSDKAIALSQVFHPAAADVGSAARVTVRAGEERAGIDVQLQYVPLASVSGTMPPPAPGSTPTIVTMVRVDEVAGFDPVRNGRPDASGRFTIPAVAPGQYKIVARSNNQFAFADVLVAGEDVDNVALAFQAPLTISGQLRFEGDTPPLEVPIQVRAGLPLSLTVGNLGFATPTVVLDGAAFRLEGVAPGAYKAGAAMRGVQAPIGKWWIKSIVVGGRDVLDAPIELRQSVQDAVVTLCDQASEVAGTVHDAQGNPVIDGFVVVFSANRSHWFLNSRRVVGVRPTPTGYSLRNLPPGEYRVAAADLDQSEWFDPAVLDRLLPTATPLTIAGTEKKTVDLVVR